jgi:hypothetical protein
MWSVHTVRRGDTAGFAAPRFYQVDVTGGNIAASATQAATHDPDGANVLYRFVPSLALNRAGDMALGYSTSSSTTKPAIKYAGRLATDAVNTLPLSEQLLIQGTGTQVGNCGASACTRWGDYTAMTLDPDGCRFWYTNEYYAADGLNFLTRIGSFAFPSCTPVTTGSLSGTVTNSASNPVSGATVALGSRVTTTNVAGQYTFASLPSGSYPREVASSAGYVAVSATNIVVPDGGTATRDFTLAAAPTSGCFIDTTQTDFEAGIATNCDLSGAPGDVKLTNAPTIDQQNGSLGNTGVGITVATFGGQTFTPATSGLLTRADINLFCSGCTGTTPNLTLSLRATSGGLPTGADLASATISGFSNGSTAYYTATFAVAPSLTAGVQYALVLRPTANPSAGVYALTRSGTDVYTGGTRVAGAGSGTVWSIPLSGGVSTDAGFKIYIQDGYKANGGLISGLKDANPSVGFNTNWATIAWNASVPANTSLQFQVAAGNSATGPFNFVGPDGTAATFFTNGASLSQFNGNRYLKYQASFASTDNSATPTLNDITICFSNTPPKALTSATPGSGQQGATLNVALVGVSTNFAQGTTTASFGAGITVNTVTVGDATHATANITIAVGAATGARNVTATTGGEVVTLPNGFSVTPQVPASLTLNPGASGQGAQVTTPFATPLSVTVKDAFNNAVSGVTVTFTAPASGASGTFSNATNSVATVSDGSGVASAGTFIANATVGGPYNVSASASGVSAVNFALTNLKRSQTIAFTSTPPRNAEGGGATYTPVAIATSGLTVAMTIDASATSICSISGGMVSFIATGTCVIDANQAGNGAYNAAPQVQQSVTVNAPPTRTWVSRNGDDGNLCTLSLPCLTFQAAHDLTGANGEINCLGSGDYGQLTITKSITIKCSGLMASIAAASGAGITIAAGAADKIVIDGLDIEGLSTGSVGISVGASSKVHVLNTTVRNFASQGIALNASNTHVFIDNSFIIGNPTGVFVGGTNNIASLTSSSVRASPTASLNAATASAIIGAQSSVINDSPVGIARAPGAQVISVGPSNLVTGAGTFTLTLPFE